VIAAQEYGYWGVALAIALESMGVPVPGETALVAAALYAGKTQALNIWVLIAFASAGAILGDNIGYWIGREIGFRMLLPLFREAFAKRRCLIPTTGFYEWQQREDGKQPYRFHRKDLEPFAFAGIWEFARLGGEEILSTAIIVGEANPLVGAIHDRMPVILMWEDYDRWLAPTASVSDLKALLNPYDPALMEAYAVSRVVNSVKNDTEGCIEPLEDGGGVLI
jgi:hypothetical protein